MQILLLNELEPTPHNAPLKCFATRRQQQIKAFAAVRDSGFINISRHIGQLIDGLWRIFMAEALYTEDLTPEKVMAMGREWIDAILDATPPEEYLNRHKPDEILSHYKPDEVLSHYKPDEVLSHYKPEQLVSVLTNEQRLAGLTEEQIRAYLERLQQSKNQA